MKKVLLVLVIVMAIIVCGATKVKIGVTPIPFVDILEFIRPQLEEAGIELEIVVFSDYVLPNLALSSKELDANFFQHAQYLKSFTAQRGIKGLVSAVNVLIAPMGFYLKKPLEDLKKGDKIALMNDPTNETRALLLLHNNGLITLKDPSK
ncbi:MAG TPA: MetQ/NlpA family ABC transporter substrate-binding protein, partial [Mesotoga sp.]|nr:MetQ/NlpA family ABC transporter substrate-binding protein [Mesotoga sp.]